MGLGLRFELFQNTPVTDASVYLYGCDFPKWKYNAREIGGLHALETHDDRVNRYGGLFKGSVSEPVVISIYSVDLLAKGALKMPIKWADQKLLGSRWVSRTFEQARHIHSGSPVGYLLAVLNEAHMQLATAKGVRNLKVGEEVTFEEGKFVVNKI